MNIIVYSKPECSHCVRAANFLTAKKIDYTALKLNVNFTREELIEQFPTARTFPVVVIDGVHIGGADQLIDRLS